jgi:hypothetical protein
MDPVRQFVARKQQLRIPLHVILATRADAIGALVAQKPLIPNDSATGVLYAIDTSSSNMMVNHRVYGPDGGEKTIPAMGKTAKADLEAFFAGEFTGRFPRPDAKAPASMQNAWFMAEMFDYGKLGGLNDKPGATVAADLKAAAKAELEKRLEKLGDPASADIIAWSSLQRLAAQMEKFEPTKDAGKELKTKVKARADDAAFKPEVTAWNLMHSLDTSVCAQRKAELDKAKAGYQMLGTKFAATRAGLYAVRLIEGLNPPKKDS